MKSKLNKSKRKEDDTSSVSSDSSSDSDDEESDGELHCLSHMDHESIDEFAHNSLACLLLLWLKNFLKSKYGFTDK